MGPARRAFLGAAVAALAIFALQATETALSLRERAQDSLLALGPPPATAGIVVVDIDRASLAQLGGWPLGRDRLADILARVAEAEPRALGVDVLLEGADRASPSAIIRRLARDGAQPAMAAAVKEALAALPEADERVADSVQRVPTVLAIGLETRALGDEPEPRTILPRGVFQTTGLWSEPGLTGPAAAIAERAEGLGLSSLPSDLDGVTRHAPLLAVAGRRLAPSLSVELLRVARGQPLLRLDGEERRLRVGEQSLPLGPHGLLRLLPTPALWPATVSASAVLAGEAGAAAALAGAIVLIGSSAPEAGGVRTAHGGAPRPTVLLHAMAIAQLRAGLIPQKLPGDTLIAPALILAAAAGGAALGVATGPWVAAGALAMAVLMVLTAAGLWLGAGLIIDPVSPPLALLLSYGLTAILTALALRRREARLRQRFEQHLAPQVVAALIARPDALRLEGHVREITALFTDVEGFTAMTARAQPHALISALDRYFDGLCAIIIAHGGMVDKIVGDAVHAMFNAPLDVPDHADQAIACAEALAAFAETFRAEPAALALGFGRTRIGLETGPAIVGDVGGRRKLDYTAHGDAVNAAARLEAANKALATTVAIGAGAAARTARSLRPLGPLMLRGRDGAEPVFTLWPADMDEAQRQSEAALLNAALAGDRSARAALAAHAQRRAEDPALQALVTRLACLHGPDPSSDEADEIADEQAAHARVEQLNLK